MKRRAGSLSVFIAWVAIDGHNTLKLCRAAALFKELKAFDVSISRMAWVLSCSKSSRIV